MLIPTFNTDTRPMSSMSFASNLVSSQHQLPVLQWLTKFRHRARWRCRQDKRFTARLRLRDDRHQWASDLSWMGSKNLHSSKSRYRPTGSSTTLASQHDLGLMVRKIWHVMLRRHRYDAQCISRKGVVTKLSTRRTSEWQIGDHHSPQVGEVYEEFNQHIWSLLFSDVSNTTIRLRRCLAKHQIHPRTLWVLHSYIRTLQGSEH